MLPVEYIVASFLLGLFGSTVLDAGLKEGQTLEEGLADLNPCVVGGLSMVLSGIVIAVLINLL